MESARARTVYRILASPRETLTAAVLAASLLWAFWPTLAMLIQSWSTNPNYSHGYLVPLFALFLLWYRRDRLAGVTLRPSWWGLPLLLAALGLHFAGIYVNHDPLVGLALLPCAAGVCVLLGGWAALPWAWPAVLFLFFLLPLPHRLEVALAGQLQWFGSRASTFLLQALGFVAFTEGNVIRLGEIRLEVAPACSGLSMLHVFFALSTAAVLVLERPWYEKVIVFLSAVPIALFANVTRITVTAILHRTAGSEVADLVFHDLAGWLMMLLALGLLWVELRTFSWVVVTCSEEETSPVALTEAELDPAAAAAGVVPLPLPAEEPEPLQAGSSLNPLFLRPADAGADLGAEALKRPASSGPVPLVYLPTRPRKDQQSG